jgi:hypothetical protein
MLAPFTDPSWAIWAHCSIPLSSAKRVERWFDLHPALCYTMEVKNGRRYYEWLKNLTTPVYMQKHAAEIPASVKYPRERIQAEWPGIPFGSQTAWMIALALSEGYDTIGLFGIHYQHDTEYFEQRANAELWVGIAYGRGVKVVIPEGCPLAKEPAQRYGYDTHSAEDFAERRRKMKESKDRDAIARAKASGKAPFDPSRLVLREDPQPEPALTGV